MQAILREPGVPRLVKLLPLVLIAYLALPIDLIPDFLPGVGYLDDVVIVLLALWLMIRLTPPATVAALLDEIERPG